MRSTWRALVVLGALLLAGPPPSAARLAAENATGRALAPPEMEAFLLNAPIVAVKGKSKGVTEARRVVLSDGRLTHDAQVQDVYVEKPLMELGPRNTEINFKDLYRYNIAAYRLSVLLGLDNVPMSVERVVNGTPAAVTWWIDDVKMDENARKKKQRVDPNPSLTASYVHVMRVFDELIQNRDRNGGNLLWSSDGKAWLIDHTRAFRLGKQLLKPDLLKRCERTMFERLRELSAPALTDAVGTSLSKPEIEALLARRDVIVKMFEQKIAERGAEAVLFDLR